MEHLRALFSLANAILKLLTEKTRETLKLKETSSAVQAYFQSLVILVYFLLFSPTTLLLIIFKKSYEKLFLPVLILMLWSISSLPDLCAQDGLLRL